MTAVAAYLLPNNMYTEIDATKNVTRSYVLLTSQWQKWDIFSPNPLRRVSEYVIERDAGDRWETVREMTFDTLPWWERAKELKVLGRLEEERWNVLAGPYLRTYCPSFPSAAGTKLRLTARTIVLPFRLHELENMSSTYIPPSSAVLATVTCPRSAS